MPPSIYSIPFDKPFLDTLVAGLMRRAKSGARLFENGPEIKVQSR